MVVTTSVLDFDDVHTLLQLNVATSTKTYVYVMIEREIIRVFNVLEGVIPESWQVHFLYVLCFIW